MAVHRHIAMWLKLMLVVGLVLGPVGNLGALETLSGDCAAGCPCDDPPEPADATCCDQEVEVHVPSVAEACTENCPDCDCGKGVAPALPPNDSAVPDAHRWLRQATSPASAKSLIQLDIFIPPQA